MSHAIQRVASRKIARVADAVRSCKCRVRKIEGGHLSADRQETMSDSTDVVISDDVARVIDSISESVRGAGIIIFANDIARDHRRVRHGIVGDRKPGRDHRTAVVDPARAVAPAPGTSTVIYRPLDNTNP